MKKLILIILATVLLTGCSEREFSAERNWIEATEFPEYNIVCFNIMVDTLDCEPSNLTTK